ncbi:MAG: ABC transporter substrate-binding protein, partial [bacterium]|nr:ABC transporter substrate-binding protein [bacterium]
MPIFSPQSWRRGKSTHSTFDKKLVQNISGFQIPRIKQLKYLPRIISPKEYRLIKFLAVIFVVNALFLTWKAYEANTVIVAKQGGSYTEGLVGAPQTINPLFVQNNDVDRDLVSLVYSGLSKYDVERKIVGDLASRYEISEEGKAYTFFLRTDVKWHDGKPFSANDVL